MVWLFILKESDIYSFSLVTIQAQPSTDALTAQDRKTTERKLNPDADSLDVKSDENLNRLKPEAKSRALINASKVVQQVANVKTFLFSFKKDSEYVFVEIPKRPDGKWTLIYFTAGRGLGKSGGLGATCT